MSSDLPLVSCIMPTRGRSEFARQAVESFAAQTYANRELIIIDDADARSFRDPAPSDSYYLSHRRMTIGAKRNLAISRSRGEIIAHFDDDDYSHPDRLADQVGRMIATGRGVTAYDRMLFTDGVRWWRVTCSGESILGTSLMYSREVWAANPFPAECVIGEEHNFIAGVRRRGKQIASQGIAVSDGTSFMFARVHAANTSPKVPTKRWEPTTAPDWAQLCA